MRENPRQCPPRVTVQVPDTLFPLVRHLSCRLTPVLYRTPVTPNQITTVSLLLGLAGAACFALGERAYDILGGLSLTLGYVLDNCDGEIARLKQLSSAFGARLDDVADWLVDASFFAALGYGASRVDGEQLWLWLGLAAAAGATIDYVVDLIAEYRARSRPEQRSREEQASAPRKPQTPLDWFIYVFHKLSRADFCLIVLGLAAGGVAWVLLPLGAVGAQVYWITDLFERARGYHT